MTVSKQGSACHCLSLHVMLQHTKHTRSHRELPHPPTGNPAVACCTEHHNEISRHLQCTCTAVSYLLRTLEHVV
jgi:hypothetical protein